jgi:hypothetical protein
MPNLFARHDLLQEIWVPTGKKRDGKPVYDKVRVDGVTFVPGKTLYEVNIGGYATLVPEWETFATAEEVYWATHPDKQED